MRLLNLEHLRKNGLRYTLISLLFAAFGFMLGFYYNYHLPRIKAWALIEIEKQSQEHLPFRVWPEEINFTYFLPGIEIRNIRILPKSNMDGVLAPSKVDSMHAQLSLWALFKGQIRLSKLVLSGAESKIFLNESLFPETDQESDEKTDFDPSAILKKLEATWRFDFKQLSKLPLDEIRLKDSTFYLRLKKDRIDMKFENISAFIENRFRTLLTELEIPHALVKKRSESDVYVLGIETKALLDEQGLHVSGIKLKYKESYLVGSGLINFDLPKFRFKGAELRTRLHADLAQTDDLVKLVAPAIKRPKTSGTVNLDLETRFDRRLEPDYQLQVSTENLRVENYFVGQVKTRLNMKDHFLTSPTVEVSNSAGSTRITNLALNMRDKKEIQGTLETSNLEIGQLLHNLDIKKAPLKIDVTSHLPCQGQIDNLKISCKGQVQIKSLHVHSGEKEQKTIVKLNNARATGSLTITDKAVSYSADNLQVGTHSRGSSRGRIDYKKGFNITYSASKFDFSDIENLANLKIEGNAELKGSTKGNSKTATFQMDVKGKNLWLDNYALGHPNFQLRYKTSILTFRNVTGQLYTSRYTGNLSINLKRNRLFISAKIPFADLTDIQKAFERKIELPFEVTGTGSGRLRASGPFQLNRMTYNLESSFFRGSINRESFDELKFNVASNKGLVQSQNVSLSKGAGLITMKGRITPEGKIDSVAVGRKLRMEQSETLLRAGLNLAGQFDFTMSMKGQLPRPTTELNGRLTNVVTGDRSVDDSNFSLRFKKQQIEGNGRFIGNTLNADFILPLTQQAPLKLKLKTEEWDFTHLFSIFSDALQKRKFETVLTSDIELYSPHHGLWNASGHVNISKFRIRRGPVEMLAPTPIRLTFDEGEMDFNNFRLEGKNTFLNIETNDSSFKKLNTSVNGKVDLTLLTLVTPFLEDLQGTLSLSTNITGRSDDPRVLGSAYIEYGYVRLPGFPHAFENIRSDVLFNQKNILINTLRANLGGGEVTADGKVFLKGNQNYPVQVAGSFDQISLNIPDGIKTQGSGTFKVHGDRFPYTLSLDYDVNYGDMTMEFAGDKKQGGVESSSLLPKVLRTERFEPILLDLNINLKNKLLVKNSLIDASVMGSLDVHGAPKNLDLNGRLVADQGGKVFFRDNEFEINTLTVQYNNAPPDDPYVYLVANSRVSEQGQSDEYDVQLLIQGRERNREIVLTSQPPLSEQQIVSLLALGVITDQNDLDASDPNSQNQKFSTQISSAILQAPISKGLKNTFGVDFQISSFTGDDNATVQKIVLKKQWTPKFGASTSRTIEKNPETEVELEYKVNKNLSVLGVWTGKETGGAQFAEEKDTNPNTFGMDLRYKVEFR